MPRARWTYVDEARTHEIHAGLHGGEAPAFLVRESAAGAPDPADAVASVLPVAEAWEAQLHHLELETRLSLLGRYWRLDRAANQWTRLVAGPPPHGLDLREVDVPQVRDEVGVRVHHLHHREALQDVLLVAIPRETPRGARTALYRLAFRFPDVARGHLDLVHPHLVPALLRSLAVRENMPLASAGYTKVVRPGDYDLVFGHDWLQALRRALRGLLVRIQEGDLGEGHPEKAVEEENAGLQSDFLRALSDPRVVALHARFLAPGEEARLLEGGERVIRLFIADKRKKTRDPEAQTHLSILEASLLAKDAWRAGLAHEVDPALAALVKRFAFYL